VYLLVFHAYINEIHGSRSKIHIKYLVIQRCAEGFNSGVKGLINLQTNCTCTDMYTRQTLVSLLHVSVPHDCHHQGVHSLANVTPSK
jgi:hypothetical protein